VESKNQCIVACLFFFFNLLVASLSIFPTSFKRHSGNLKFKSWYTYSHSCKMVFCASSKTDNFDSLTSEILYNSIHQERCLKSKTELHLGTCVVFARKPSRLRLKTKTPVRQTPPTNKTLTYTADHAAVTTADH